MRSVHRDSHLTFDYGLVRMIHTCVRCCQAATSHAKRRAAVSRNVSAIDAAAAATAASAPARCRAPPPAPAVASWGQASRSPRKRRRHVVGTVRRACQSSDGPRWPGCLPASTTTARLLAGLDNDGPRRWHPWVPMVPSVASPPHRSPPLTATSAASPLSAALGCRRRLWRPRYQRTLASPGAHCRPCRLASRDARATRFRLFHCAGPAMLGGNVEPVRPMSM